MFIRERMIELQDSAGYQPDQFRKIVDIPPKQYEKIVNGQQAPSCRELARIARALNVSTDYLLGMDIPVPPEISDSDSPDDSFRIRFIRLLIERNEDTEDICTALGKSHSVVNSWRCGRSKPNASTLISLARYFGCSTDYLLGMSMERQPSQSGTRIAKQRMMAKSSRPPGVSEKHSCL